MFLSGFKVQGFLFGDQLQNVVLMVVPERNSGNTLECQIVSDTAGMIDKMPYFNREAVVRQFREDIGGYRPPEKADPLLIRRAMHMATNCLETEPQ